MATNYREVLKAYQKKVAELKVHQDYADRVVRATDGKGMTKVLPLATMGTGGGALLCDHCKKPIILEGGRFNNVPVDVAWKQNPDPNWVSWIYGGMVVEIQSNYTLRIYHGYIDRNASDCCNVAKVNETKAADEYKSEWNSDMAKGFFAAIKEEFPNLSEKEQLSMVNDIKEVMYSYDPGIGINQPTNQE